MEIISCGKQFPNVFDDLNDLNARKISVGGATREQMKKYAILENKRATRFELATYSLGRLYRIVFLVFL